MENLLRSLRLKTVSSKFLHKLLVTFDSRKKQKATPVETQEMLIDPLSARENEVLHLLDGPLSTPEIAAQLYVSANTVRTHIKTIYSKLAVHGRSGAVRRAKELRLLI